MPVVSRQWSQPSPNPHSGSQSDGKATQATAGRGPSPAFHSRKGPYQRGSHQVINTIPNFESPAKVIRCPRLTLYENSQKQRSTLKKKNTSLFSHLFIIRIFYLTFFSELSSVQNYPNFYSNYFKTCKSLNFYTIQSGSLSFT